MAVEPIKCPRCGHENDAENQFCDYCGLNLTDYFSKAEQDTGSQPTEHDLYAFPQLPSRLQEHGNKKQLDHSHLDTKKVHFTFKTFRHKKRWAFVAAAIVFVVGGYSYGQFYYSKSTTLNRVTESVAKGNPDHYFVSKTAHRDDTKLIAGYLKANPVLVEHLKNELSSRNHTSDGFFTYQKTGTYFGIFPKYQVVIDNATIAEQTYSVKIKTKPYALILLNGKVMSYADAKGNYTLNHLTSPSVMVSAKYHHYDQGITTKPIKITPADDHQTFILVKKHALTTKRAQATLNGMYAKMQDLTNHGTDHGKLKRHFIDGKHNHYYQSVHQLGLSFHQNQFKASYNPIVTSFKRDGRNHYTVKYNLTYRFDIGDQIHMQVFKTTAVLQRHGDGYRIASVISEASPIKDKYYAK